MSIVLYVILIVLQLCSWRPNIIQLSYSSSWLLVMKGNPTPLLLIVDSVILAHC